MYIMGRAWSARKKHVYASPAVRVVDFYGVIRGPTPGSERWPIKPG